MLNGGRQGVAGAAYDRYEHLVHYYGYYSDRSRGARRLIENGDDIAGSIRIDEPPANTRRKASWARLIQKVYEVDPLECVNCGSNMRIIALIDDVDVVERILRHLDQWDLQPDTLHTRRSRSAVATRRDGRLGCKIMQQIRLVHGAAAYSALTTGSSALFSFSRSQ